MRNSKSPTRSGWACDDREKRDQGRALFEPWLSLRRPPLFPVITGCPQRSAGTQTAGRLTFAYFSLAKQRTSESAAGASPGLFARKERQKKENYQRCQAHIVTNEKCKESK